MLDMIREWLTWTPPPPPADWAPETPEAPQAPEPVAPKLPPDARAVTLDCHHRSQSYAINPSTGRSQCLKCYHLYAGHLGVKVVSR